MGGISRIAKLYIGGIAVIGGALLVYSATRAMDWTVIALIAMLIVIADAAPALLLRAGGGGGVAGSVAFPLRMAAIMLTGPWGAIIASAVTLFSYVPGGRPIVKRAFNAAQFNISVCLAGLTYLGLGGHVGPPTFDTFVGSLLPFAVAALVYYLTNTGLVTVVLMLTAHASLKEVWRQAMLPFAPTYLGYGPVGLLIAILWSEVGVFAAVLAIGPVVMARWASGQLVAEREAQQSALRAFARAVETKDYYTRGHSERVGRLAELMGRQAGLPDERVMLLGYAGLLHDIGKIRVPTSILQKSGPLTRNEYAAVQLHPVYGQAMMRDVTFLDEVLPAILHHHERYDGAGYPMGLARHDIPEFARMIAVADALDSMTSTRSYRSATPLTDALDEIRRNAGTQFDPAMVGLLDAVVAEHGWRPKPAPEPVDAVGVRATFDHDDPLRPVPVEDGDESGDVRHSTGSEP